MTGRVEKRVTPLRILMYLLLLSALLRVPNYDLTAQAQASEETESGQERILGIPFTESGLDRILIAFEKREAAIVDSEKRLETRRETLNRAKSDIIAKIEELETLERRLASTLSLADAAAENDIAQLASVYENMKPKDAADLFAIMAPDFAAGFLSRMQPQAAAAVMAELDPDVGHTISVIFAGRNANAFNDQE